MSWKAGLSRHLSLLRFFACPDSPSSKGVLQFYTKHYQELKLLNPNFQMLLRTTENAFPAVQTDLQWTTPFLLKFMIQAGKFRDLSTGQIAQDRVDAAQAYINFDWDKYQIERWSSPNFDPERPNLDEEEPEWRDNPKIMKDLETYLQMKKELKEYETTFKSGPNDEYIRGENALLMCQRVDLWCSGPKEVERAVCHLYKLARALNDREVDMPLFISDFYPGSDDMRDD